MRRQNALFQWRADHPTLKQWCDSFDALIRFDERELGMEVGLHDANLASDRIRQEPVLATLRYPRLSRLCDRQTRIRHFRNRAEELRAVCEEVILHDTKLMLHRLADSYEHLANTLETTPQNS